MHAINSFNVYNKINETFNSPINLCLIEIANDLYEDRNYDIFESELLTSFEELMEHSIFLELYYLNESEGTESDNNSDAIVKGAASFWLSSLAFNELKNKLGGNFKEVLKNAKGLASKASKAGAGLLKKGSGVLKKGGSIVAKNPKTAVAAAAAAIVVGLAIKTYRGKVNKRLEVEKKLKEETDLATKEKLKRELAKLKEEETKFKLETKEKVDKAKKEAVEKTKSDPNAAISIINKGKSAANSLPND